MRPSITSDASPSAPQPLHITQQVVRSNYALLSSGALRTLPLTTAVRKARTVPFMSLFALPTSSRYLAVPAPALKRPLQAPSTRYFASCPFFAPSVA